MAKMTYTDAYPDYTYFNEIYNDDPLVLDAHGGKSATYLDDSGNAFELVGKGLTYNGADTALAGERLRKSPSASPETSRSLWS